jgi:hypothetical protein
MDRSSGILSYEARRGILTANATTPYYLGFANLSTGPFVLEMPARGVQGGISDSWQNAIAETDVPGKYLVLAPGQTAENVAGYVVCHSPTVNIFFGVRLTDADPESAKQALAQLEMYPYAQRDNPSKMEILDAGTKPWSGQPPRGMEYWERLDDVIQHEPVEPRDILFHAMLRPLGQVEEAWAGTHHPAATVRQEQLRHLQAKSNGEGFRLRLTQWQPDHRTS